MLTSTIVGSSPTKPTDTAVKTMTMVNSSSVLVMKAKSVYETESWAKIPPVSTYVPMFQG